jgi:AcrR family transcriptional regulator
MEVHGNKSAMGRIATFDDQLVYGALGRVLATQGQTTIAAIRDATGLSIGSLYHRFGSREGLMAEAWFHTISLFHSRVASAVDIGGIRGAIEGALATPRFCRTEPSLALLLVCGRASEFLATGTGAPFASKVEALNKKAAKRLGMLAKELDKSVLECQLALVAFPLGAVRTFLPNKPVPESIDATIEKVVLAILGRSVY